MLRVKDIRTARLLVAFNVAPQLSLREDWSRRLFERLQDEFPQLLGVPVIEPDTAAIFMRPAADDVLPVLAPPICQLTRQAVQIILDRPTKEELGLFPAFVRRVYDTTREIFHVGRVSRFGRVQQTGYILDSGGDAAADVLLSRLTKLTAAEATDVQVQFVRQEGIYNINLALSAGASSPEPGPSGTPLRNVIVAQSDVNNADMSGDVDWATAEQVLVRGAKHAGEEIPAFLRERLDVEIAAG